MRQTIIGNRYKILKKLGVGATGNVYKVRDLKNKRIVALKILSKQKTSSEAVQRFKREFSLLAGLHHPNLCSVYDFGILKDGRSYFTMEYIDGKNIFEVSKGLSYERIYPWIVELCRVLEYIHAKGLIHYDIKPGNVLIAKGKEQGTETKKPYTRIPMPCVKLMDFGLAGEQQIKGGGMIRGTFPYIAPELIKGFAVDHRADLYSLGVLLYEVFTRRSFQEDRESFVTLLTQRIQRGSASPSKIVSDIPEGLEQLISRLLAFESSGRFSHANEIVKEINKIAGVKFAFETEKTLESYLLSSKFVGRDREMGILKTSYEKARHGEGKVVLVTGDAGIGKSRLLKEFKVFTQLKRSHCFIGYAYKNRTNPLEPFYDIFSGLINYIEDGSSLKTSLAVLFKMFPYLPSRNLKKHLPKLTPLGPEQEKLRTFEALSELIGYCASNFGELVILLEDLHWADYLTIQFLEYLGRNIAGTKIFICGTSRKEELAEHLGLKMMISNLSSEDNFNQIELKPFRFKSLYSFLDSTITHDSNSSELTRYLMKKTGGNPFFVEEIMRTLLHKKGLNIGEKVDIGYFKLLTIPGTIDKVVLKRIEDLDQASQCVIKFGAVLLRNFTYDLMKQLTGLEDTELSRSLWELKNRQVLIEENNSYRFYHTTLRELLNKRLGYQEKRKLNYQVGKTIEIINKKNKQHIVEDLAYYFINAKDHTKGVKYGLKAAKKNQNRFVYNQAIQFYNGVFDLLSDRDLKLRFYCLQELAKVENLICNYDSAIKYYRELLKLKINTFENKINSYVGLGYAYLRKGEIQKTIRVYQKAVKILEKMKPGRSKTILEARLNVQRCTAYLTIGDYESAGKINFDIACALERTKKKELMKLLVSTYRLIGDIELYKGQTSRGNYDKAISCYRKAYKYAKRAEDQHGMHVVLNNLGISYEDKNDNRKAINCYQKSIKIAEKVGDPCSLAIALCNLSNVLKNRGCYHEALVYYQRALLLSKKISYPELTGYSFLEIGECLFVFCDYKKAEEYLKTALKMFSTIGMKVRMVHPTGELAEVYRTEGKYTLALSFYRKALKISKDIKHQHDFASSLVGLSALFVDIGEFPKAERCIADTLKIAAAIDAKNIEVQCYTILCNLNITMKNYVQAHDYYKRGMKVIKRIEIERTRLLLILLGSEIHYRDKKYMEGSRAANKAEKLANKMGTKNYYVEALLLKVKNGVGLGAMSMVEITEIMKEAVNIAEEIGCPEVLWQVYFEYGSFLQDNEEYLKALGYYQKCIEIFMSVSNKIKNKMYRKSYLNRPDRQIVFGAIDRIEKLIQSG